ncbi:YopX family protein [Staphylococcus haemolyticus]|uniref:YopX family protein n=1 Tax=Staphylococcus haemolyticus TaxID=1283 RepID=UPI002884B1FB|nr:YopX family protein [Staphylococcus haemolyticus]MDT0722603.1 YopX family protein [Staphylococcus haemolyticus]
MAELKFRAWDKEENKMWNVETLYIEDEWVKVNDGSIYGVTKDLIRSYCLMQSTGVTSIYDDNNTEIYEGDIVKTNSSPHGRFIGYVGDAVSRFEVRGVKQYKGLKYDLDGSYVVIGNVHQNPELLESD